MTAPTVDMAPIGNGFNFATEDWQPLNSGKIYTYLAGSTTPYATYTERTALVQNANPIILGVDGRPPHEIWLVRDVAYKFILTDSDDNPIQTYDNLIGAGGGGGNSNHVGTATTADSGATYTATLNSPITSYADGDTFYIKFTGNCAAAPTLNVDGVGAVTMLRQDKNAAGTYAIAAKDILDGDYLHLYYDANSARFIILDLPAQEIMAFKQADETVVITTGTAKFTFAGMPSMAILECNANLVTASSSGLPTFDLNDGGVSFLSTKITIDANELTSKSAATPPVISTQNHTSPWTLTMDIDVAGTGAKGWGIEIRFRRL